MTKTELRELVKAHFSLVDKPVTEVAFAEAKLIDGTVIKTDGEGGFEIGQKAFVIDAEGQEIQAPEGEHILEDDTVVVIDSEGVITGIKTKDEAGEGSLEEAPAEAEEASEEQMAEHEVEEEVSLEDEEGDMKESIIDAITSVIDEVVQPQIEELKKEMAAYKEKMEKLSSEPATDSALKSKFSKQAKLESLDLKSMSRADRALLSLNNKLKNK